MRTVSGTVYLRPARVGLAAHQITDAVPRLGSAIACSAWGGMYYPIFAMEDTDLRSLTERLGVDFWHPLDADPRTQALCQAPGLGWRGRSPWGPFDPAQEGMTSRLLPSDRQQFPDAFPRVLPTWEEDDPCAALYAVWLGHYPEGEEGARQLAAYRDSATVMPLPREGEFPVLGDITTPVTATGAGLTYTGESPGAVLVLVGDDPEDLVRLWNARAMGSAVFPWPVADADRFERAVRAWLQEESTAASARQVQAGDGSQRFRYVTVLAGELGAYVPRAVAVIDEQGWRAFPGDIPFFGGWIGHHPVQTGEERAFSVPVDRDSWRVDLPMPRPPGRAGPRSRWPGIVVADITVHQEDALPPGRLLAAPAIRQLAPLLDQVSQSLEPFQRSTGEGRAVAVQGDADTVTVGLVRATAIFERIFDQPGWSFRQSDEGRFGSQLIERLGGVGAETATQPAVRAVLEKVRRAPRAIPMSKLIEEAENWRGEWPGPLSGLTPRGYATQVVYGLLTSRLLQPAMSVRCPRCTTDADIRPEDLASDMRCTLCGEEFPLGLALALGAPGSPWLYRLAANIPPERLRSTLPVMAALAILREYRVGSTPTLPHVLGLEVHAPEWKCELDITAAIMDGPSTVVVIGEVKGGRDPIDQNDLDNLTRVQSALRAKDIETLILAATTRSELRPEEHTALRALCERAPERLRWRGGAAPALPLVLLGQDLSAPWMTENHPWHWSPPGGPPLGEIALQSCRRNLGLIAAEFYNVGSSRRLRLQWRDDAPAASDETG
jgi:hypothetical protein